VRCEMNEVQKAQTLEERITGRIREQIGELMTDDDLRGIIKRGVEKALFEERYDPDRSNAYHSKTKASLVDELAEKHLAAKMKEAVDTWLKENPERIQQAVDDAVRRGVSDALTRTMDERFAGIFQQGVTMMQSQGLLPHRAY
jgi:hypothetical protein